MDAQPRTALTGTSRRAGTCPVCGLGLWWPRADGICLNRWCWRPDREFSTVYSLGVHAGALRQALVRYKSHSEWSVADAFAGVVARYLHANFTWFEEFDVITGVPSYTGPGARRAWDPVGEILDRLRAPGGGGVVG